LKVDRIIFVPLLWSFGYRFSLPKNFSITPFISGGAAYLNPSAVFPGTPAPVVEMSFFDPMLKAGASAEYRFNNLISLAIAGECGIIFEKTIWIYAGVTVNAVFRF
jgi:hypothetical protein